MLWAHLGPRGVVHAVEGRQHGLDRAGAQPPQTPRQQPGQQLLVGRAGRGRGRQLVKQSEVGTTLECSTLNR